MATSYRDVRPTNRRTAETLMRFEVELTRRGIWRPATSWQYPDCTCPGALPAGAVLADAMRGWPVVRHGRWIFPVNPRCPHMAEHIVEAEAT